MISVIVPALDEEARVGECVRSGLGEGTEVLVVDGGSRDGTATAAAAAGARVLQSPPGRALQLNRGAAEAGGDILLFLHADCRLPPDWAPQVRRVLAVPGTAGGAFRLRLRGGGIRLRLVEAGIALRSRLLSLPYGDQAVFLRRETFRRLGGYPDLPILEDVELVRRLRREGRVAILDLAVSASARRWRSLGVGRVTLLNQAILAAYLAGLAPARLAGWYRRGIITGRGSAAPTPGRPSARSARGPWPPSP